MEGNIAPYNSRPKLLEAALAFKAFGLPLLFLPFAWSIVSGIEINTFSFIAVWALAMQGMLLDHHATNYLAKRLFRSGSQPNRILVELTSKAAGSKSIYMDSGVLQIKKGRLMFEGVDSNFDIPIDPSCIETFFETDGNYSSLKLKMALGAGYTITIRQKWNWNEGYRLGDLHDEMRNQPVGASCQHYKAVLPPETNSSMLAPWFPASGYTMIGIGVATFSTAWIRTALHLTMPLGTRATWVISGVMLAFGIVSALLIYRERLRLTCSASNQNDLQIG